ncbi:transposase [Streptomyces sp. NPDC054837]
MLPLGVVQTGDLNEFEIRSLDGELEALCASVDDVFARPASRENLRAMVRGLLSEVPRKNLWQLAEFAGHPNPDRLQGFLAKAAWDADELRDWVRAYAVAALAAGDAVLIADETGDIKKGTKAAEPAPHGPPSTTASRNRPSEAPSARPLADYAAVGIEGLVFRPLDRSALSASFPAHGRAVIASGRQMQCPRARPRVEGPARPVGHQPQHDRSSRCHVQQGRVLSLVIGPGRRLWVHSQPQQ